MRVLLRVDLIPGCLDYPLRMVREQIHRTLIVKETVHADEPTGEAPGAFLLEFTQDAKHVGDDRIGPVLRAGIVREQGKILDLLVLDRQDAALGSPSWFLSLS